jgi:hypothetical protein
MTAGPITGALLLLLLAGCSSQDAPVVPAPAAAPSSAACPQDPVDAAVCRYVSAVQADDTSGLSAGEQAVAAAADDLPAEEWTSSCELVGDVTVLCEVTFGQAPELRGLHVAPVNAEHDDGKLTTPDGEAVRYEVVDDLGTGPAGTFG